MDEYVERMMSKWPGVPAVYGWLSLDQRGRWCLQGRPISHRPSVDFISRNYTRDDHGAWYFQNGPQRVFVSLDYTPWVAMLSSPGVLCTHTGVEIRSLATVLLDEEGNLLMLTEYGIALLCDQDLAAVAELLVDGGGRPVAVDDFPELLLACQAGDSSALGLRWHNDTLAVSAIERDRVAAQYGFNPRP